MLVIWCIGRFVLLTKTHGTSYWLWTAPLTTFSTHQRVFILWMLCMFHVRRFQRKRLFWFFTNILGCWGLDRLERCYWNFVGLNVGGAFLGGWLWSTPHQACQSLISWNASLKSRGISSLISSHFNICWLTFWRFLNRLSLRIFILDSLLDKLVNIFFIKNWILTPKYFCFSDNLHRLDLLFMRFCVNSALESL